MGKNKKTTKILEDRIKDGDIPRGRPIKFRQSVELQFKGDTLDKLKESNKGFILTESEGSGSGKRKLVVTVEGIHTGMTKNMTFYPGNTLDESTPTWTTPHKKPVLKNHDTYTEPLGRILKAEYVESTLTDKYTVRLTLELTDQEAIDKVLDGRYLTLSVGGSAQKVTCSVCAKDLINEGFCGHYRGRKYEGKTAHWIIGNYTGDEISFVNMPADVFSQVIAAEIVSGEGGTGMGKGKKPNESSEDPKHQAEGEDDDASLIDGILGEGKDGDDDENEDPGKTSESDDNSDNDNPDGKTKESGDGDEGDGNASKTSESGDDDDDNEDDNEDGNEAGNESVEDLKRKLKESEDREAALQKKLDTAEADNLSLSGDLTEAKSNADSLQTKLDEAATTISTLEDEKKTFEEQNIKLARFARRSLAERVVDLRIMHGKDKPEDRESALSEWSNSSSKVLETTIKDLLKSPRTMARVNSPGYVVDNNDATDEDGDQVTKSNTKENSDKRPTLADFETTLVESMVRDQY